MFCALFYLWWVLFRISGGVARTTNIHSTVTEQIQKTRARCNWKVICLQQAHYVYFSVANGEVLEVPTVFHTLEMHSGNLLYVVLIGMWKKLSCAHTHTHTHARTHTQAWTHTQNKSNIGCCINRHAYPVDQATCTLFRCLLLRGTSLASGYQLL